MFDFVGGKAGSGTINAGSDNSCDLKLGDNCPRYVFSLDFDSSKQTWTQKRCANLEDFGLFVYLKNWDQLSNSSASNAIQLEENMIIAVGDHSFEIVGENVRGPCKRRYSLC